MFDIKYFITFEPCNTEEMNVALKLDLDCSAFYKRINLLYIMKNVFLSAFVIIVCSIGMFEAKAQSQKFVQVDLSGGISEPMRAFRDQHMFASRGISASGGFDYFFGKLGLGFSGGYFTNKSSAKFTDYIEHKYFETIYGSNFKDWNTKYIQFGPSIKLGNKWLEFDIYGKAGYSQIVVPDLYFYKTFFNQSYEVYRFSGVTEDWQFAWSAGARLMYKINRWFGVQAKADYFTTSYMSDIKYDNTYRDATDGNRNGIMEDAEYFESQKVSNKGNTNLNVLNMNIGLIFQIGRTHTPKVVKMMNESPDTLNNIHTLPEKQIARIIPEAAEPVIETNPTVAETKPALRDETKGENEKEIPVINAHEENMIKADEIKVASTVEPEKLPEIPVTTFDAPEAKYDAEAAEFLYKAGESYFATNDFESAMPCFNKLKADPNYPRAKYMFAMTLCATGNCNEAKKEYKEFAKNYKESDARTLEIIFASHFERCAGMAKGKTTSVATSTLPNGTVGSNPQGMEYRIQFIAIRKPDMQFPKMATIGNVATEFFPKKALFRYTLDGYVDLKDAAADVYKVRKLGFRDAFIAVYQNGVRVNTLYHAK